MYLKSKVFDDIYDVAWRRVSCTTASRVIGIMRRKLESPVRRALSFPDDIWRQVYEQASVPLVRARAQEIPQGGKK